MRDCGDRGIARPCASGRKGSLVSLMLRIGSLKVLWIELCALRSSKTALHLRSIGTSLRAGLGIAVVSVAATTWFAWPQTQSRWT